MWLQKHLRQEQKNEMSMTSPAGIWQPLFLQPPNWCKQLDECLGLQSTVPRQRQRDSPIDRMTSFWGLKEIRHAGEFVVVVVAVAAMLQKNTHNLICIPSPHHLRSFFDKTRVWIG
jgi:hypothetical protein